MQHLKCLQCCIQDARKNVTFMGVAPNLGTGGEGGNFGNSWMSPLIIHMSPPHQCLCFVCFVLSWALSCGFPPRSTPSSSGAGGGGAAGLVGSLSRPWGMKGLIFHFLFLALSPPELCPESCFFSAIAGSCELASTTVRRALGGLGSGLFGPTFLAGVSGWR